MAGEIEGGVGRPRVIIDYRGWAPTPARPVPGATAGGTIRVLRELDFESLDPAHIGDSAGFNYAGGLLHRSLTWYLEDPANGTLGVVGDLATNAGEPSHGDRVWTYHLRDGIAFEDGTPITSRHIARGLERSFGPVGTRRLQQIRAVLDPRHRYRGPTARDPLPPGVTAPDDRTLVLATSMPVPHMPFLLADPVFTPVPAGDPWLSTGPYRRTEYVPGVRLVLERNPHWDPDSDPVRHQYPDAIVFELDVDRRAQTERLRAATAADATALMDSDVSPDLIPDVKADHSAMGRVHRGPTPYVTYLFINTRRVKNVNVRRALNYAHDRSAYMAAVGGLDLGLPATTIMSPTLPGYKAFDVYGRADGVERARQLLRRARIGRLTLAFPDTGVNRAAFAAVAASLARAGLDILTRPIDPADYYAVVAARDNDCDLIAGGWAASAPTGASTLGILLDGKQIGEHGNLNLSLFNNRRINAALGRLRRRTEQAEETGYGDLDERIMRDHAPVVPLRYVRTFAIRGTNVGNAFMSPFFAHWNLTGAFVMPAADRSEAEGPGG